MIAQLVERRTQNEDQILDGMGSRRAVTADCFLFIEKHELFECTSEIQLRRNMTLEKTNMFKKDLVSITSSNARRGGAEVAGLTLDRKIRVRFPAYPHRVWAL